MIVLHTSVRKGVERSASVIMMSRDRAVGSTNPTAGDARLCVSNNVWGVAA